MTPGLSRAEERIWIERALGIPLERQLLRDFELTSEQLFAMAEAGKRRAKGVPLQYILGEWDFAGLTFFVDERVLIPRPETELLLQRAVELAASGGRALDLCTGSGCIAIALRKKVGMAVDASDVSEEALAVARKNAARYGLEINFIHSDMFAGINNTYDVITCNPPYIRRGDMPSLQAEVLFEPRLALDGGEDGLAFYRVLAKGAPARLRSGGTLLTEVGLGQADEAVALITAGGLNVVCEHRDLAGIPRFIEAKKGYG